MERWLGGDDGSDKFAEFVIGHADGCNFGEPLIVIKRVLNRHRGLWRASENSDGLIGSKVLTIFSPPRMIMSLTVRVTLARVNGAPI